MKENKMSKEYGETAQTNHTKIDERQEKPKQSIVPTKHYDKEAFFNTYGLVPTTIPPFALITDDCNNDMNTQKRYIFKRHQKQKEKVNRNSDPDKRVSSNTDHEDENTDSDPVTVTDSIQHWDQFFNKLNLDQNNISTLNPQTLEELNTDSSNRDTHTTDSSLSTHSSNADILPRFIVDPESAKYNDLIPNLDERWRGEDRMKIMESIPYIEDSNFKTPHERSKFYKYVNELKFNFYSDKNFNSDWNLEKMKIEKKHVLEKNEIDETKIVASQNMNTDIFYYNRSKLEPHESRRSIHSQLNYGNMEPKDLEKNYYKLNRGVPRNSFSNRNYHLSMLQKKENITEYFKQQYGKKKTQWLPSLESILFQNRYLPLFCRLFIVILSIIVLSLASRIYVNSKQSYYGSDLTTVGEQTSLRKYTLGQQPSTIMAITVNTIAVVFEIFVAIDEFKGEPLGLRNPLGKLRLLLLDMLFIIFSSANLALAFGSMFDDDWVCLGGTPSKKSSPKINYICRKQRTLSSFLFIILSMWVVTFTISISRVVNKASFSQR